MVSKKIIFTVAFFIGLLANVKAQINGVVFDRASRKPIAQVELINLSNQEQTLSNDNGEFYIKGNVNQLLVFRRPGYKADTILLIDLKPLRRYMVLDKNVLNTITVSSSRTLKEEYAQVFNKANPVLLTPGRGLLFYPSSYFSREGKQARRFVRMLKHEETEKIIDRRFNLKTVGLILPINQHELDAFLVLYRPTLKFVKQVTAENFKIYVLNCYQKFKLLPPEQRALSSLK